MKKLLFLSFFLILVFALLGCDALEDALNEETEEDPPSKPSALQVELTDQNTIYLTWQDNADVEDGFIIEARIDNGSWDEIGDISRNRSSFTFDEVEENVTYNFRIKAYNEAGESDWYTSSDLDIPIFPPTDLSGYGEDETIILEWIENSNVEAGYKIQRRGASGGPWTDLVEVETDVETYTDEAVEINTDYEYRVYAFLGQIESDYSNNVTASTSSTQTEVAAPSDLNATQDETQINLSWTDNSDNEDAFIIERMSGEHDWSVIETTSADVTTFEDENVITDVEYSYRVKAKAGTAYSSYSNTASVTINSNPSNLEAPSNLDGVVSESGVSLTWEDNSSDETGFFLQRSLGSEGWELLAELGHDIESYYDEDVMPTSTYHYRVQAFSQDDEVSDYSNTVTFEIPFFAPTNLQTTFSEEENFIHLTWIDNSVIEQGFEIYVRINGGEWHIRESLHDSNATQFIDYDFSAGNFHEYRVAAIWEDEIRSDFSNTSDVTIPGDQGQVVYYSNFDNEVLEAFPQGWNYSLVPAVTANISDEQDCNGSGKSIKFVDPSVADWGTLSFRLNQQGYHNLEVNFKLLFDSEFGTLAFVPHMNPESWNAAGFLQFEENGLVLGIDGPTTNTLMEEYQLNHWYQIKMVFNVIDHTYDIYIDDELLADDYAFIYQDNNHIVRLDFNMWNDRSLPSGAYVDEFEIKLYYD